ncbi:MAG: GH25 family lysozyme, partial [Umezawaea sp.]
MATTALRRGVVLAAAVLLPAFGTAAADPVGTAGVAVCGHTADQSTVEVGTTGAPTTEAQCQLNLAMKASRYTPIAADGTFGTATKARAEAFQRCAGLTADGVVGTRTWSALNTWSAHPRKCSTTGTSTSAQARVCGHSDARPTLRRDAAGSEVEELQCRLDLAMESTHYPPLGIDGRFGGGTESRVADFQRCANLGADGVVGANTWSALVDWSGRGGYCSPPKPAGFTVDGIDTAKYQHPGGVAIDWRAVRAAGVEFATVKATRGLSTTDEYLVTDLDAAWTAGLAVAPYHFYTATAANTGAAQADRFIAAVRTTSYTGRRAGDLPPVFDLERVDDGTSHCPTYATVADTKAWLDKVESAFGRKPTIYTQKSFLDDCMGATTAFAEYPMQLADYRRSITAPPVPKGST